MVFFNCNACGETLKRNKVEIHYQTKCRNCEVLSCVDCSKEFWGDEYKKHLTCISEEEKYSGSNYIAKANKGEVKQELWQKSIQEAVEKNKSNPKLRDLLQRLIEHPNIPRKQKKFENFMKSSFGVRDNQCIAQIWEIISQVTNNGKEENKVVTNGNTNNKSPTESENNTKTENNVTMETNDSENVKKLSKREKKEQRKLKQDKKEKKDKNKNGIDREDNSDVKKDKKKRKRKHEESEEEEEEIVDNKTLKRTNDEEEMSEEESEKEEKPVKKRKIKFNWEKVITDVLQNKGEEIAIKKLRKTVLAEYAVQGGCLESEGELCAKFNKKVLKNPKFKVLKERVKLAKVR